jgi:hypothetical protein
MMDNVQSRLTEWIDSRVIAEIILEELKSQSIKATLANGQDVWLDFLKN